MWGDNLKILLKGAGYQDERDLKTFLPYLQKNNFFGKRRAHLYDRSYSRISFKCPITNKFRVKINYGVRKGSIGRVVTIAGEFVYKGKILTARHKPGVSIDRVTVAFDDSGKTFSFDTINVSRTRIAKLKHVYVSADQKRATNIKEPVDMFGADIKVGDVVVWTWNMSVPGGSKPYTAFGTIIKVNPQTVSIEAIFVRGKPKQAGKILRAGINNVAVLDDGLVGRLLGEKLKA